MVALGWGFGGNGFGGGCGGCFRHDRNLGIFTQIDSLGTRILVATAQPNCRRPGLGGPATYSAGCNAGRAFFGAIQKASGRSNRKSARSASASRQITIAPATPATVTIREIVPISVIRPVFSSSVRVTAIGRKKAR